jgi:16S rRNA processing protein RimM
MTGAPSGPGASGVRLVTLGRITGPFGVQGWVKVRSYTEPPEAILRYPQWRVQTAHEGLRVLKPLEGRPHGTQVVARIEGIADRTAAESLGQCDVSVPRQELPPPGKGQYYWSDLEGLKVVNTAGTELGRVDHFVETPANAVMVVIGEREHWVPLVPQYLKRVDLDAGYLVVDWTPEL